MDAGLNPYSPGAGRRPPELVGREDDLAAFDTIIARTRNRLDGRPIVIYGLRGVGKTVLLEAFKDRAERMDWQTMWLEAQPGPPSASERIAKELALVRHRLGGKRGRFKKAMATIESFTARANVAGVGAEVTVRPNGGRGGSGELEFDLRDVVEDLCEALAKDGLGLAMFVDEMQDLDQETLASLVAIQHEAGRKGWPFYLIGAGLPNLPAILAAARSYAERLFEYRQLGSLSPEQTRLALTDPAQRFGVSYEPEALDRLADVADGYPFFLQTYGFEAWSVAPGPNTITIEDAKLAIPRGDESLARGFFQSRWMRATAGEQRFLWAMALDGAGPSQIAEVAARLAKSQPGVSPARASLIEKGLIYSPGRGEIAFTVPGMARFIDHNPDLGD